MFTVYKHVYVYVYVYTIEVRDWVEEPDKRWKTPIEERQWKSVESMDGDSEVFGAFLRSRPRILVADIGNFNVRDFRKLSSLVFNLNPALQAFIKLVTQRKSVEKRYAQRRSVVVPYADSTRDDPGPPSCFPAAWGHSAGQD